MGIYPSVALFCHYFVPEVEEGVVAGRVSFHLRSWRASLFPDPAGREWPEWCHKWCYIRFLDVDDSLVEPVAATVPSDTWESLNPRDEELAPAAHQRPAEPGPDGLPCCEAFFPMTSFQYRGVHT
jgi:hypothetical protein